MITYAYMYVSHCPKTVTLQKEKANMTFLFTASPVQTK